MLCEDCVSRLQAQTQSAVNPVSCSLGQMSSSLVAHWHRSCAIIARVAAMIEMLNAQRFAHDTRKAGIAVKALDGEASWASPPLA